MNKISMLALASLCIVATGCSKSQQQSQKKNSNEVLVEVNGHQLTRQEATKEMEARLGGPPPAELTKKQIENARNIMLSKVVDQFVKQTLLLEEADKLNIKATDKEIEKALAAFKKHSSQKTSETVSTTNATGKVTSASKETDDNHLRQQAITGIRIEKLLAIKIPPKKFSDEEIARFTKKYSKRLTDPKTCKPMAQDKIKEIMQNQYRHNALFEYIKTLQQKAEIKHSKSVLPPTYPQNKATPASPEKPKS